MADLGYANVKDYTGGKSDWVDAGLFLETDGDSDILGACQDEEPVQ